MFRETRLIVLGTRRQEPRRLAPWAQTPFDLDSRSTLTLTTRASSATRPMASPPAVQKTTEVRRPRSSQKVSVSWDEGENTVTRRTSRLQFELAECVETKTVTTTTTTKRAYPPLLVRQRRPLSGLDSKEYPLANRPTPPELARFTVDLDDNDSFSLDSSFEDVFPVGEDAFFGRGK